MALTYTALVGTKTVEGSIRQWVHSSTLPSTDILTIAEQYIYRTLRVREMIQIKTNGLLTIDALTEALPSDYLWPIYFGFTGIHKQKVFHRMHEDVEEGAAFDGDGNRISEKPTKFWADATNFNFDHPALLAYPYRFIYYGQPTALGTSNETNFLTDRFHMLLTAACRWAAWQWLREDTETQYYQALTDKEIRDTNEESEAEASRDRVLDVRVM